MAQTATITERLFTPVGSYILVEPKEKDQPKSGIFLTDDALKKTQEGVVVGLGSGKITDKGRIRFSDLGIELGSIVLYQKYGFTEVEVGYKKLLVLDMDDILGVFNG